MLGKLRLTGLMGLVMCRDMDSRCVAHARIGSSLTCHADAGSQGGFNGGFYSSVLRVCRSASLRGGQRGRRFGVPDKSVGCLVLPLGSGVELSIAAGLDVPDPEIDYLHRRLVRRELGALTR